MFIAMTNLVHLNALRALEASARHQSFSAAAEELKVTPAAVGQLVRTLEQLVGAPLFYRKTSGKARLIATENTKLALPDIRAGLDKLGLGLDKLQAGSDSGVLTVTVSPAFAAKWLLPRIDSFQSSWPDIDMRLDISAKSADFALQAVDIGVRYGAGDWSGLISEKLMTEDVYPVCSPQLLKQTGGVDLTQQTLIHDLSMTDYSGLPSWDEWLKKAALTAVGLTEIDTSRGMQINNSAAVLQAVINGHGVALARSVMARDDLAAGRLVRLFPEIEFVSSLAYYVVYSPESASIVKLQAFRDWLFTQASTDDSFEINKNVDNADGIEQVIKNI